MIVVILIFYTILNWLYLILTKPLSLEHVLSHQIGILENIRLEKTKKFVVEFKEKFAEVEVSLSIINRANYI